MSSTQYIILFQPIKMSEQLQQDSVCSLKDESMMRIISAVFEKDGKDWLKDYANEKREENKVIKMLKCEKGESFSFKKWSEVKRCYLRSVKLNPEKLLNRIYYKIMDPTLEHRGFKYELDEVNNLQGTFDPDPTNLSNGLYFCKLSDVHKWMHLHPRGIICEVLIPNDAQVYKQGNKYKADKILIRNPMSFEDFTIKHDLFGVILKYNKSRHFSNSDVIIVNAIKRKIPFKYVDKNEPNYDSFAMIALEVDGMNIKFIKNPSEYMKKIAVQQNGFALRHMIGSPDLTYDIIMTAVKQNGLVLKFMKHEMFCSCKDYLSNDFNIENIYIAAVQQNKNAIKYIESIYLTDNILNQ